MLGGDKFKNNLGNRIIIKCHECGDTDLRYVGYPRTDGYPSGYVCGNGHETWGAVDDWDLWGQSDSLQTPRGDCCCESLNCDLPNYIKVEITGLIGVQARESCGQQIWEDVSSRTSMPISICGACCESSGLNDNLNTPWYIDCGCDKISAGCKKSDDSVSNPYALCGSATSGDGEVCGTRTKYTHYDSIAVLNESWIDAISGVGGDRPWEHPFRLISPCPGLNTSCCGGTGTYPPVPNPFAAGYPDAYGAASFINEIISVTGNTYRNKGYSHKFIVRKQEQLKWVDPCDTSKGCCHKGKITLYVVKRNHPTKDSTGNSGFTWSVSQEGLAVTEAEFSCGSGCDDTPFWESSGIDPYSMTDFCNLSNEEVHCTNCNSSIGGGISVEFCEGDGSRRFWPSRVPYFKEIGGVKYQLIVPDSNGNIPDNLPTYGECNCDGYCPDENDPNLFPDYCNKNVFFPDCLARGTEKCVDLDSRYRIECSNPNDFFNTKLINELDSEEILKHRHTFLLNGATTTDNIKDITIEFNPIAEGRGQGPSGTSTGDLWSYPLSPNTGVCQGLAATGFIANFGDPMVITPGAAEWYNAPNSGWGARGIQQATIGDLFELPDDTVQQPHCLRRVRNPNFASEYPFYYVNTADVGRQQILLDRYYKTSEDYDYLWKDYPLSVENYPSGQAFINRQGDLGLADFINSKVFPFGFTARSGSIEEPEIVAVIHSSGGEGGQIAFRTIPVTYETDELLDPADQVEVGDGYCPYKTRVTAFGYGVGYPLIDDPIWSEATDPVLDWPDTYDPNNPVFNTTTNRSLYEYPVFIPGTGYEIGDKIEFRCWKCLEGVQDRRGDALYAPEEDESVWEEECVETIVATATVTELNDTRVAPSKVDQVIDGVKIVLDIQPSGTDRYYETWKLNRASALGGSGHNIGDSIDIRFTDTDCLSGVVYYDQYPSIEIVATGENGSITDTEITESGSFYKIIRTGGIRWYEFDEEDENGDLLISVGNCPCNFDVCGPLCNGCVSKDMYTGVIHQTGDASPLGFPGAPISNCITDENIVDQDDNPIPLWCPSDSPTVACPDTCTWTSRYTDSSFTSLFWVLRDKDRCADGCGCNPAGTAPSSYNQTESSSCSCSKYSSGPMYISGWTNYPNSSLCWPLNSTQEFNSANYAKIACSGEPEIAAERSRMSGHTVLPPKKPQYRYVWLPNVSGFMSNLSKYVEDVDDTDAMNALKDSFLAVDACNPGRYDRFGHSYRWPTKQDTGLPPCRKKVNPDDTIPSGVERTLDDYCRSYGFYQQRQPTCEVIYRGQYIMRAAAKAGIGQNTTQPVLGDCYAGLNTNRTHALTTCEPIIEDIAISLNRLEAQFDVSVGAPFIQDYLFPENLPTPYSGSDGFLESRADSWNYPSLTGTNNTRFFDHGFHEPNRYAEYIDMALPENQQDVGIGEGPVLTPVFTVNPLFSISDTNGAGGPQDYSYSGIDIYLQGVWDLSDPRNNCTGVCNEQDVPVMDLYPEGNIDLPARATGTNFIPFFPYPWENANTPAANSFGIDHYAMFQNNSAELVLGEITECEACRGSYLIHNRTNYFGESFIPDYGYKLSYTDSRLYEENENQTLKKYIVFRAFGRNPDDFTYAAFSGVIDEYLDVWGDRITDHWLPISGVVSPIYLAINSDDHRTILWNMLFEGAANDKLSGLTKVEVFEFWYTYEEGTYGNGPGTLDRYRRLFVEDRCEYYNRTGTIKSINVVNSGNNYAFEIEERVPATGIRQDWKEQGIEINVLSTLPKQLIRRRETYQLEDIEIIGSGKDFNIGDILEVSFKDKDARRGGVKYNSHPTIEITDVGASGEILDYQIAASGDFWKFKGTGQHRAYPISIILNNYWDYPNGEQNFGRHGKFIPVVGVDPKDKKSYGKIKRVDVLFGGVDYVQPGQYWKIDTSMGDYDSYGNIQNGLDLQHLVDPCKYIIHGSGLSSQQVKEYQAWKGSSSYQDWVATDENGDFVNIDGGLAAENDISGTMFFPEELSYYVPQSDPSMNIGDPFTRSIKYYMNTNSSMSPIRWEDRVRSWDTVIITGSCPIDASGGLLNRTYDMALVEEAILHGNRPLVGNCPTSMCDTLIDKVDSVCASQGADSLYQPDNPYVAECGDPCPIFTVYDAHRFPIGGTNYIMRDMFSGPTPWLLGCEERLPLDTLERRSLFCYDSYGITSGGQARTQGHTRWPMMSNSNDKCYNAEYSLYAEFGKWTDRGPRNNVPAMRAKAITYSMKDPITMKVSYDTDRDKRDIPVNYSGIACSDPNNSGLCEGGC